MAHVPSSFKTNWCRLARGWLVCLLPLLHSGPSLIVPHISHARIALHYRVDSSWSHYCDFSIIAAFSLIRIPYQMESLPQTILETIKFERSNEANGSVFTDSFYQAPSGSGDVAAGTLLKLQKDVYTSKYLLPPATAMSRFLYQTETLKGAKVPTSAFILWPFSPKSQEDGCPVVAWAHGTTGLFANSAPSSQKNL